MAGYKTRSHKETPSFCHYPNKQFLLRPHRTKPRQQQFGQRAHHRAAESRQTHSLQETLCQCPYKLPETDKQLNFRWNIYLQLYPAKLFEFVAEWTSYFCLARNLFRPLGSTHIFTQSGWLILFNPNHLSEQHKLGKAAKTLSLPQSFFVQNRRNDSPLWGKPSNLWTPCVYSLRPRFPSWIWIKWLQYATHRNNFKSLQF